MMTNAIGMLLFPAMMAFAASSDLFTMTISNKVSLILVAGFFALAFAIGMDLTQVLWHVGAAFVVLAATFAMFSRGWIGGGDAKLAAATALWFGFEHLMAYALYASIFGGLLTLALLSFRLSSLPPSLAGHEWIQRLHKMDGGVPYGIALAASALMIYPDTIWMMIAR